MGRSAVTHATTRTGIAPYCRRDTRADARALGDREGLGILKRGRFRRSLVWLCWCFRQAWPGNLLNPSSAPVQPSPSPLTEVHCWSSYRLYQLLSLRRHVLYTNQQPLPSSRKGLLLLPGLSFRPTPTQYDIAHERHSSFPDVGNLFGTRCDARPSCSRMIA